MKKQQILNLFDAWNEALKTGDAKQVAALYASDAVLLPTISNEVRHSHDEIVDYFQTFLMQEPQGSINESNIRIYDEIAINSGVYTFSLVDDVEVQGRFTFVYRITAQGWKIIEHHSSAMPE